MGLPFIKLQQHTLNHGGTNSLELEGRYGRDGGAGGCGRYRGPAEGRGRQERESVTCVMEATLLLGSTIFKERS